ncbi:DUF1254 domain-containing protein [Kitasatospora aburaviensis]
MTQPELEALAADAYVYGYPLVSDLTMVERFTGGGMGTLPAAPFNRMSHATRLAEPGDPFVSVNNDTVYSIAQLDLSEGPLVLHVPDTAGAYYVLQFVDAWTDNFAYVGSRATGTGEQSWLIVPPHWHGTPPDPGRVIVSPTTIASIVGRFACTGPDDLPRVQALQEALTLSPLEPGGLVAGLPAPDPDVPERLAFFERLRVWMAAFPPAGPDVEYQRRFAPLGLLDPDPRPTGPPRPSGPPPCSRAWRRAGSGSRTPPGRPRTTRPASGVRGCTSSTSTPTTWAPARSTTPSGASPTAGPPTSAGRPRPAPGSGATTRTRPCSR